MNSARPWIFGFFFQRLLGQFLRAFGVPGDQTLFGGNQQLTLLRDAKGATIRDRNSPQK